MPKSKKSLKKKKISCQKIGVVIDRHNVGGVEKIAIEQVRALQDIGEDARLVVLRRKGVVQDAFSDLTQDIKMEYIDDRVPNWLTLSFKFPMFHFFSVFHLTYPLLLPLVVKKREYDYLFFHGTSTSFTGLTFKWWKGIPFSAFIWDPIGYIITRVYKPSLSKPVYWLLSSLGRFIDMILVKNVDHVLVGGSAHDAYFCEIYRDVSIKKVPPGVHPSARPTTKKKNYILMVTAWKPGKHPEYLLEILKQMPNLKIKMVGTWVSQEYRAEFERFVKKNKLGSAIDIVGAVTEQELRRFYSEARVVLQTNDDRGFGMPALEAAAHGTTFIIPKGQGVCELFVHGKHGFFTEEKNTKEIVKYLTKTLKQETAFALGKAAHSQVLARYSWKKHAQKLKRIYST